MSSQGQVITFYSYKGGTGRSMALANVAWILAANGKRVLAIDWDFEAPGLHEYFLAFHHDSELLETSGLLDLLWDYVDYRLTDKASWPVGMKDLNELAEPLIYAEALDFPFDNPDGCLHFLASGQQGPEYAVRVSEFDWHTFYTRLDGGNFLDAFRRRCQEEYDFILIDSRTGFADTAGICTIQMPDTVVLCFTYNRQSIQGIEAVAESILSRNVEREMRFWPVPMRVESSQTELIQPAKAVARNLLDRFLPSHWNQATREKYWVNCNISQYPTYAVQERLAVFEEEPHQRSGLLADLLWLTSTITDGEIDTMVNLSSTIRSKYNSRFTLEAMLAKSQEKQKEDARYDVLCIHDGAELPQVETIARELSRRGVRPWLDKWNVRPGEFWLDALKDVITEASAAAVFIGPSGFGRWQEAEVRALIELFVRERRPLIPVLLPGSKPGQVELPLFLRQFSSVEFRESVTESSALDHLEWGITGRLPVQND